MKLVSVILGSVLLASGAHAKTCDVTVEGNDAMSYNTKSLSFAGCSDVKLTLKHTGKLPKAAMGHNLVISSEADMKNVLASGTSAGPAKDYLPTDKGVLVSTKTVGGGEADTITFKTDKFKKGTKYKFFCTFPGHSAMMNGDVAL